MARQKSRRERGDERGFTLIELMVVVVIIAILAAVVVPMFFTEAKKVKAGSEVNAMIAELAAKEERYRNENQTTLDDDGDSIPNAYRAVAACPAAPSATPQAIATTCLVATDWLAIGVQSPETTLRCSYQVIVGDSNDNPATSIPSGATYNAPASCCATSWYMIHAKCDIDGNGTFSHYISASFDTKTQITNEGN